MLYCHQWPARLYCILLLLLRWRCSPGWALASFTVRLQAFRSLALSLHSFIPIFLRFVDTSSIHLIFGLPLRLVARSFPYIFFWNCGVLHSFYVTKPSYSLAFNEPHNVLSLIITSNSQFRRILHNSFSFTRPYIFRSIFGYTAFFHNISQTVRFSTKKKFIKHIICGFDRLCGLVVRVSGYRYRGPGFDPRRYQIF